MYIFMYLIPILMQIYFCFFFYFDPLNKTHLFPIKYIYIVEIISKIHTTNNSSKCLDVPKILELNKKIKF